MIVYLDTNVYIGAKYKFDSGKMATLKNLVKSGRVTVLYTEATRGEVTQHLEEDVRENVTKYNSAVRKNMSALNEDNVCKIKELKVETIVTDVIEKYANFLELDGVKEIPLNPLDVDKLFGDYFAGNPPFETKKTYEFKDAIMINAVKNYQKIIREQICIVSSDEGFRKAFSEENNFIVFEYLGNFLKYCNEKIEEENKISECIEIAIKKDKFSNALKEYINNLDIWIDYYEEWDCQDKEIGDTVSELLYIERIRDKVHAFIYNQVVISVDITYRDEDTSYYDKEEGRYLFENYIHSIERHVVELETEVCCDIENNSNTKFLLKDFKILEDDSISTIDLNYDTRTSYEKINSTLDEKLDLEHCSQCGKKLYKDSGYEDYEGRAVCSSCMKSDDKGEVCPECGRKIPHQYMKSGFCESCANDKNN